MILVFNASPIIVLAKAGMLDLLLPLGDEVWVPEAVASEVAAARDPGDSASSWIAGLLEILHSFIPQRLFHPFSWHGIWELENLRLFP